MATIDRTQLLNDTKTYLGPANTLTDTEISNVNETVISEVGDDDQYYSEILCKSLERCAFLNKVYATAGSSMGKKRTKVGPIEEEFYQNAAGSGWEQYIKDLDTLCPILPGGGYSIYRGSGIVVNPGDSIDVNPSCGTNNGSYL